MEDTLRERLIFLHQKTLAVLILVLMEDTLREDYEQFWKRCKEVLILVLMEDTLRGFDNSKTYKIDFC